MIRTEHPLYETWRSMRNRCNCRSQTGFASYGGRGIRVCRRWDSFDLFLKDMGPRPSSKHTIDRIDTEGHYTPINCRWATMLVQGANMRKNVKITAGGKTLHLREWARRIGIDHSTLIRRLQHGWEPVRAVTAPKGSRR